MREGRPRFEADRREREELSTRFFEALRAGDIDELRELLATDAHLIGDSGSKAPQWGRGIFGADKVLRLLATLLPSFERAGGVIEPREINGQPGAIVRDREGNVVNTRTLDIVHGRIRRIRAVLNPDKLAHVGPVADAWAFLRELGALRQRPEGANAVD